MDEVKRRQLLTGLTLVGSAAVAGSLWSKEQEAFAQSGGPASKESGAGNPTEAFAGLHKVVPLPFDPKKLKGISEKLILSHWENNYSGAVKALNSAETQLAALLRTKETPPLIYGGLKREQLLKTGSIVLHEHYFSNLGGTGTPTGTLLPALNQAFGSWELWLEDFKRTAMALAGGTGWVVLGLNWHTRQLENYWLLDHSNQPAGSLPLLVLDMYEHAFQMDYGSAAAKYFEAFLSNINWEVCEQRFLRAKEFAKG